MFGCFAPSEIHDRGTLLPFPDSLSEPVWKFEIGPEWGSESDQQGSNESRFGRLLSPESRSEMPSAIFQTVSLRTRVNKQREGPWHLTPALRQLQGFGILWGISLRCRWPRPGRRGLRCRTVCQGRCSSYRGGRRPVCRRPW